MRGDVIVEIKEDLQRCKGLLDTSWRFRV